MVLKNKEIYIMLTNTGTVLSKMIKMYSKCNYAHVSIALDPYLMELYSFGRKKPRNPFNAGFVKENYKEGVYALFPEIECIIYSIEVTHEEYGRLTKRIDEFNENPDKYRYNILGLVDYMREKSVERKDKYVCSQFVAAVLKESGIKAINKDTMLTTADDFLDIPGAKVVYKGLLGDFEPQTTSKPIN